MRHLSPYLLVLLIIATNLAYSHQQKEAYTSLLFNLNTKNLEASHRFYSHDAEHVLAHLFNNRIDIIGDGNSRKQFAYYIQDRFQLQNDQHEKLPLEYVGYEVEGKYLWVYQETSIPPELKALDIKMDALIEVWPQQVHHVNVEKDGIVRSVRFREGDSWKTVLIE